MVDMADADQVPTAGVRPWASWLQPALLALLGGAVPLVVWWLVRPVDLGGSDPGMWEAAACLIGLGATSPIAPFFPFCISLLHRWLDLSFDQAGWCITIASCIALGPATWWLARTLGVPGWLAMLAALAALANPWLAVSSYQCQPDLLTAVAFLVALVVALRWMQRPGWARLLPLLLVIGLLPQVREHAGLVCLGLFGLLLFAPGAWHQRLLRLVLALAAIVLLPILAGEAPAMPWQLPWVEARWGEVITHFFGKHVPMHLLSVPLEYREAFGTSYDEGSRMGIALVHARLSFHSGSSPWIWLGLALLALPLAKKHRLVLLIGLLPAISVLGGAQQPRHVAVLIPIAAVCWVTAIARFGRRERVMLAAITVVVILTGFVDNKRATGNLSATAHQRQRLRSLSSQICAQLPPDALYTGENPRTLIYCEREFVPLPEAEATGRHLYWVGAAGQRPPKPPKRMFQEGWLRMEIEVEADPIFHRPPEAAAAASPATGPEPEP